MPLYSVMQYDVTRGIMWRHKFKVRSILMRQCSVLPALPQSQVRSPHSSFFSLSNSEEKILKTWKLFFLKKRKEKRKITPHSVNSGYQCRPLSARAANMLADVVTYRSRLLLFFFFFFALRERVATWASVNLQRNQRGPHRSEENAHTPVIPKTLQIKVSSSTHVSTSPSVSKLGEREN